MAGSPKRIDTDYAHGLINERIELNEEDFLQIEKQGQCKLSQLSKQQIGSALDNYYVQQSILSGGSSRGEQMDILIRIRKACYDLKEVLDLADDSHALRRAKYRIEDQLQSVISKYCLELKGRWDLAQEVFQNGKVDRSEIINFNSFQADCLMLSFAADQALEDMELEAQGDKGGCPVEHNLNNLLLYLDEKYSEATGRKRALERFILSVCAFLPKDCTVNLPQSAGSITRRIQRLKRR